MALRHELRCIMTQHVSIVRSNAGLEAAQQKLAKLSARLNDGPADQGSLEGIQLRQALLLARLTVTAALTRQESRGLHYSIDWPSGQAATTPSCLTLADLTPGTVA